MNPLQQEVYKKIKKPKAGEKKDDGIDLEEDKESTNIA